MNDAVVERHASTQRPVSVFCSYAHSDDYFRAELDKHLSVMRRNGEIAGWHDRNISAGTDWKTSIDSHLKTAEIILLLVSADFLASDYCYEIEMKQAMERHEAEKARVIPIILRDCDWSSAPFSKLQALPSDAKPIKNWSDPDEAYHDIVVGIRNVARQVRAAPITNHTDDSSDSGTGPMRGILLVVAALLVILSGGAAVYLKVLQSAQPVSKTEQPASKGDQTSLANQSKDNNVSPAPVLESRGDPKPVPSRERRVPPALSPGAGEVSEPVLVSGFVLDATGQAIEGVKITLVGLSKIVSDHTSSYGRFSIQNVPKKKGDWIEISAVKDGYVTKREKYLIGSDIEIILDKKP